MKSMYLFIAIAGAVIGGCGERQSGTAPPSIDSYQVDTRGGSEFGDSTLRPAADAYEGIKTTLLQLIACLAGFEVLRLYTSFSVKP